MTCPICKYDEPRDLYFDAAGDICGCDVCITSKSVFEYEEELAEMEKEYAEDMAFEYAREARRG